MWLYKYGAFALVDGVWFPCKVLKYSIIGEPATISVLPIATVNQELYPKGEISVGRCQVLYSVFNDGMSIETYIQKALGRKNLTMSMLDAALVRSLDTEILYSPKRLVKALKRAVTRGRKHESFVVEVNNKDEIGAIQLPRTAEIIEKLWDSTDWATQEISQLLGISYNPAHGKKERMLSTELLGDRDLTIMNREMITSRLITAAEGFKETVVHISTKVDTIDRQLPYANNGEKEVKENVNPTGNSAV
jgi:hypothetical protein